MSPTTSEELSHAARAWIDGDPDPAAKAELEALLTQGDARELGERLAGPLEFGTAGLRGLVGAGPARMNRAVVIRTTRGLAEHVLSHELDARTLPIVVGRDARSTSRAFAEDAAGVLVAAGIPVRFFERPVPTPLVAYAARQLGANAAIAITASHNPPEYNGYKVYGANAVQIVPPLDIEIAARIAAVGLARSVPRVERVLDEPSDLCQPIPDSLFERYLAELDALRPRRFGDPELSVVYTPLHGVGWHFVERALRYAGYRRIHAVPEQAEPDGAFPTVRFPNPEEPGALDLATALAEEHGADLILANDPDADRLAACVPTVTGRFLPLTGNQLGLLLADFVLEHAPRTPQPLVISSLVSSPMLADVAAAHGARFEQTLTGFKWIWTAALDLERAGGVRFVYGYEEALGYCVGRLVRDKDGVGAAVVFADLAADCKARGQSLLERLEALYRRHGLWVSLQKSVTRPGSQGLAEIERAMEHVAREPAKDLGPRSVADVTDFRRGAEKRPRWLGKTSLVALGLEGGGRVLVRPSGTEPKLKVYVDLRVPLEREESSRAREEAALAEAHTIAEALIATLGLA